MKYKLSVIGQIAYEFDTIDELVKQVESLKKGEEEQKEQQPKQEKVYIRPLSPYERTRNAVYATGNRWAIENFKATH